MEYTVLTGTAITVATVTGDAGQLGTAAGFRGRFGPMMHGLGDRPGDGWCRDYGFRGDRVRGLGLKFRLLLGLGEGFTLGDRLSGRDWRPTRQHSVSQH